MPFPPRQGQPDPLARSRPSSAVWLRGCYCPGPRLSIGLTAAGAPVRTTDLVAPPKRRRALRQHHEKVRAPGESQFETHAFEPERTRAGPSSATESCGCVLLRSNPRRQHAHLLIARVIPASDPLRAPLGGPSHIENGILSEMEWIGIRVGHGPELRGGGHHQDLRGRQSGADRLFGVRDHLHLQVAHDGMAARTGAGHASCDYPDRVSPQSEGRALSGAPPPTRP